MAAGTHAPTWIEQAVGRAKLCRGKCPYLCVGGFLLVVVIALKQFSFPRAPVWETSQWNNICYHEVIQHMYHSIYKHSQKQNRGSPECPSSSHAFLHPKCPSCSPLCVGTCCYSDKNLFSKGLSEQFGAFRLTFKRHASQGSMKHMQKEFTKAS